MGTSTTLIEFNLEVDVDRAFNDTKSSVGNERPFLPKNIDESLVERIDIGGMPVSTYVVRSPEQTMENLSWYIEDVIAKELVTVRGVGQVTRLGGVDRKITVSLKPDQLLFKSAPSR